MNAIKTEHAYDSFIRLVKKMTVNSDQQLNPTKTTEKKKEVIITNNKNRSIQFERHSSQMEYCYIDQGQPILRLHWFKQKLRFTLDSFLL